MKEQIQRRGAGAGDKSTVTEKLGGFFRLSFSQHPRYDSC